MDPRQASCFLEVARRRGAVNRQLESFASIKAQREGRSVAEVLARSLPPELVAEIHAEVAGLLPETVADASAEETLEAFVAREGRLGLAAFRERHPGVFLLGEATGTSPTIVRLVPPAGEAVATIGSATIESHEDGSFTLVAGDGDLVLDSRRLEAGQRVRIEEGRSLRIGRELVYTTFTPTGFFRLLGFQKRLEIARGQC